MVVIIVAIIIASIDALRGALIGEIDLGAVLIGCCSTRIRLFEK